MEKKIPILLSFHALTNGRNTLLFGQLTYTSINDLSFKDYSRRKTFRTLLSLYRTKPYASQQAQLIFEGTSITVSTNSHGAFFERTNENISGALLQKVMLPSGEEVELIDNLYSADVHLIKGNTIVVSDIDDTLMHSYIYRKLRKFRTLMFTTLEKRKTVTDMQLVMKTLVEAGAEPVYLSNSEQNLYPLIYRFLNHNGFPRGPLFLKQLRKLKDVLLNIKFPPRNTHKISTLEVLLELFPDKQFVLLGDNTQHDLSIYLSVVEKFGRSIRYILIRKVVERREDESVIKNASEKLRLNDVTLYYSTKFPSTFEL